MTFDEYRVALENHNFKVDYDTKLHIVTVSNTRGNQIFAKGNQILQFDIKSNSDCIPGYSYVSKSMRLKDFAYLLNQTTKFLSTPYEDRKLTPIYQLVWDINSYGQWILGYDHDLWEIGKADALEDQGYQVNFTDEELVKITNNSDLANRINALKRRVNYK